MAGSRTSKRERSKNPSRIILQQRDKDIVSALYEYRFLSREQIQRLFDFNCTTKANLRLRKLYDHYYVSRYFIPTSRGSSKAIYSLGKKAIDIVTECLGVDPQGVRSAQKEISEFKELFLNHQLNLNDIRITFSKSITDHPDMRLERWIADHQCKQEYTVTSPGPKKNKTFRPDGYFMFWHRKQLYSYFIELDQSTMSHRRFLAKTSDYLEYARSGAYQRNFGVKYFRVLVVTLSAQRLLNLKKSVEMQTKKIFWFSTLTKLLNDGVFGPAWLRGGHKGIHRLIEE